LRVARIIILFLLLVPAGDVRGQEKASSSQQVIMGRLPCATPTDLRAHGVRQLVWELMKRTSIEGQMESRPADPAGPDLFQTPFLLWSCEGEVAALSDTEQKNLRRFLSLGGFLFIDDPSATPGGPFDRSVRAALQTLFPERKLVAVPRDHVLYKTFFLVDPPAGRVLVRSLEGMAIGDRLAAVYSSNDLLGALSKDLYGNWELACEPGGEMQRETAYRMGINIIFYAMCQDYKNDRVHLPFILRRRKL
jgi:hypothetical protein